MFSSDVVAFKCHFSFYMQRKSETERRRLGLKNISIQKRKDVWAVCWALCNTCMFIHSVNSGGAVGGNWEEKKKKKSQKWWFQSCETFPVRRLGHSTRRFSLQVGVWTPWFEATPFGLLCFSSCRAHAAPASEVSGSLKKKKKEGKFYIWVYIHIHTRVSSHFFMYIYIYLFVWELSI